MSDDVRTAILGAGLAFCALFAGITVVAVIDSGPSTQGVFLGGLSLAIIAMIMFGLLGAIRHPPDR